MKPMLLEQEKPDLENLLQGFRYAMPVKGITHSFYRYPARFSPEFAKVVIETFSKPGDTILDPFMGGGTTAVEALALGRKIIGIDINPIAAFTSGVKTSPLNSEEMESIKSFLSNFEILSRMCVHHKRIQSEKDDILFKHVPWRIRNCISVMLNKVQRLNNTAVVNFLRCSLLKTAQWALDGRERIPSIDQFVDMFRQNTLQMCNGMGEFADVLQMRGISRRNLSKYRRLLLRTSVGIHSDKRIPQDWLPVKLVVTSPPYPGVHVLYHRWQVRGRRETPAPFAILDTLDGKPSSYYTFSSRDLIEPYFETVKTIYGSISNILSHDSLIVQLVSFSNPRKDVERYLKAMDVAGYDEVSGQQLGLSRTRRLWRKVPNRRWYVGSKEDLCTGKELMLFHRLKSSKR